MRETGWTKVAYRCDGRGKVSATNPETWLSFDAAVHAYRTGSSDGIGFALGDGVVGIDHDHAYELPHRTITEGAAKWGTLGAYHELSLSGTGIHDLVLGDLPDDSERRGWGRRKGALEVYGGERYLTVTGLPLERSPVDVPTMDPIRFGQLYRAVFPPGPVGIERSAPAPISQVDHDILALVRRARNGSHFEELWAGDTSAYGGDDSAADFALVSHLTFYTQDIAQIDRLFRASGLMRPKWDRADYRERTIAKAMQRSEFYQPPGRVLTMRDNRSEPETDRESSDRSDRTDRGEPIDRETGEIMPRSSAPAEAGSPKMSQATQAVELVLASQITLWHTPSGDAHVTLLVDGHYEHHPIGTKSFRDWLSRRYWLAEGKSIGSQALQDAVNTLSGQARFEGEEIALTYRITHLDGAV